MAKDARTGWSCGVFFCLAGRKARHRTDEDTPLFGMCFGSILAVQFNHLSAGTLDANMGDLISLTLESDLGLRFGP